MSYPLSTASGRKLTPPLIAVALGLALGIGGCSAPPPGGSAGSAASNPPSGEPTDAMNAAAATPAQLEGACTAYLEQDGSLFAATEEEIWFPTLLSTVEAAGGETFCLAHYTIASETYMGRAVLIPVDDDVIYGDPATLDALRTDIVALDWIAKDGDDALPWRDFTRTDDQGNSWRLAIQAQESYGFPGLEEFSLGSGFEVLVLDISGSGQFEE